MRNKIFFLLFLISGCTWGQTQVLRGKITANVQDLDGIQVINFSEKQYVTTSGGGYFTINAKPGDTLKFSAVHLSGPSIQLKAGDFSTPLFIVKMMPLVNQLSDLIIKDYSYINAESLGLVKRGQKSYTAAERKLNAASNPYQTIGLNSSAGLDPLLNWISGRTAMLVKEVEVEKKEGYQAFLRNLYEEGYYVSHFKIPTDYVAGFIVYVVENQKLTAAINSRNKMLTDFLLGELAEDYKKLIISEKSPPKATEQPRN